MNFFSLVSVEFQKIKRSKILLILFVAAIFIWLPSIFNADMNFTMQDIGISPENNFLIQGFMGMAWFMYPASMVVGTVLLSQTERSSKGILKMLSLPINTAKLCMAKFTVLLSLAAAQVLMSVSLYFISVVIVTQTQEYDFMLSPMFVLKEVGLIYLSSIPMIAILWMISVCIPTPIFAIGAGLASIVPSVLMINTNVWFVYPMCYPLYVTTTEYGKLASNMSFGEINFSKLLPIAVGITIICLAVSCIRFGQAERR